MTDGMSHELCSELLPALLRGTLPEDDASRMEEHLASCEDCRAERRALEVLMTTDVEGLHAGERAALERGVMAGIAQATEEATVVPFAPRRRIGVRVAGALGAAATVAVIATLAYFGTSGGLDESGMGGADTDAATEQEEADAPPVRDRAARKNDKRLKSTSDAMAVTEGQEEGTVGGGSGTFGPPPTFRIERRPVTARVLQKRGESSLDSVITAANYSAKDADRDTSRLEQLVAAARRSAGSKVAAQVEECARQVLETSDPTIPTFGSIGKLDGRDVLILGFAWTRARSGPLDRYMVWAWERGSCDVAVDFLEGRIETSN